MLNRARECQSANPKATFHMRAWDQKKYEKHRMRVKTAKPFVDSKAPASHAYIHMHLRLKRKEFERQKKEIIQKNNRKLLENMTFIMQTTCRVDHKNNFYRRRSLNKTQRQSDLQRITHENQCLMKRILTKESPYNHRKMNEQWKTYKGYVNKMSKYNFTDKKQQAQDQGKKFTGKMTTFDCEKQKALSEAYGSLSRSQDSVLPRLVD